MDYASILGIRLVEDKLYAADERFGIYSVNLNDKTMTSLVAPDDVSPKLGFANDLCLTEDKRFIYFTDVSSKYSAETLMTYMIEG